MENPEIKPPKFDKATLWSKLTDFALQFAVIIALPLVGFIYLGKWLDARYNQKFFVVIGILTALILSSYIIYKKIKELRDFLK